MNEWALSVSSDCKGDKIWELNFSNVYESLIIAMADIDAKIKAQGDKIRELKNAKTAKDVIDPEQKILLALKAEFKVCLFHVNIL